jgi:hypothetical protein
MSTARARRTSDYDICWPRTPLLMPRATLRRAVLVQARRPAAVRSTRRWRGACVTAGPYREQSAERVRSGMSRRTVSPCWLSISAWVRKSPQSGLVRGTTALQDGRALPPVRGRRGGQEAQRGRPRARHAGRNPAVDCCHDSLRGLQAGAGEPADLRGARQRLVRVLGWPDGQRVAQAARRDRHIRRPAVALLRPVLRRLRRLHRAGPAAARRNGRHRPHHDRQRLSLPPGGAPGRRRGRPGQFLTETERLQILRGDAAKFLFS